MEHLGLCPHVTPAAQTCGCNLSIMIPTDPDSAALAGWAGFRGSVAAQSGRFLHQTHLTQSADCSKPFWLGSLLCYPDFLVWGSPGQSPETKRKIFKNIFLTFWAVDDRHRPPHATHATPIFGQIYFTVPWVWVQPPQRGQEHHTFARAHLCSHACETARAIDRPARR